MIPIFLTVKANIFNSPDVTHPDQKFSNNDKIHFRDGEKQPTPYHKRL